LEESTKEKAEILSGTAKLLINSTGKEPILPHPS
jgi:hypothetical protein